MKLPDFLEELNQGAKKIKRSVNIARMEIASDEDLLEGGDEIPVPTMSTAPPATRPGTGLLSSGIDPNATSKCVKNPGHVQDDCRKLKRKEEQKRNDGKDTKKKHPKCPTCDKTNHPAERCWKGAGAHLKPKNLKMEDAKQDNAPPAKMIPTISNQLLS